MESSANLQVARRRIGRLNCTVLSPSNGVAPVGCVILCHGYGAPGTDLVPLAADLASIWPGNAGGIAYFFPEAPLTLEALGLPDGRAWWMIDIERFQRAMEHPEELERLRQDIPPGMPESSQMLGELVAEVVLQTQVPIERLVLGGFSQGSMVATDVALRLEARPAGLCVFSGTLLAESQWSELAKRRGPLPVLQSHGVFDPILPFAAAEALRDLFVASGFDVQFLRFRGPHTIPAEALLGLIDLMKRLFL